MHIEEIRLKNFKALQDIQLQGLPKFCVLLGANGSGKTTFFDVFGFLKDCLKENVRIALAKRGGFKDVVSRGHEKETILIELKVRMDISGRSRIVSYILEICLDKGQPAVRREVLQYKRGPYGRPFQFLNFSMGQGEAITNESEAYDDDRELTTEKQSLDSADILAIKGLGQFEKFRAANAFRTLIENWHVSDFHIEDARAVRDSAYAEHVSPSGDNLSQVAQYIFETHREVFDRILNAMKKRVPGVEKIEAAETEDGRIVLRFKDGKFKDPFVARFVSDGTIKMFAYLLLLYNPKSHYLLCVEEPENQLYPTLLAELAEEFEAYAARGGQVFVSTHSPDFLDAVAIENVFVLNKADGFTRIHEPSKDKNIAAFIAAGDTPGRLWRQGLLDANAPR